MVKTRVASQPPGGAVPTAQCQDPPEKLPDLPLVGLEGDIPHQNLGGCLLLGDLFLPSGCQGRPGVRWQKQVIWGCQLLVPRPILPPSPTKYISLSFQVAY